MATLIQYAPSLALDEIREGRSDESVISVKELPLTDIGGRKAMSWTMGADVLPDCDGSRKSGHRVWWLPYSKYPLSTYGKPDETTGAAVYELIEGIEGLDKAAASGEQADGHGALANCQDAAV
ncbi:hypothetical protein [Streptomyces sp. YKOK-I1]